MGYINKNALKGHTNMRHENETLNVDIKMEH